MGFWKAINKLFFGLRALLTLIFADNNVLFGWIFKGAAYSNYPHKIRFTFPLGRHLIQTFPNARHIKFHLASVQIQF